MFGDAKQFRKKPIVIEAIQLTESVTKTNAIQQFCGEWFLGWIMSSITRGQVIGVEITTLESNTFDVGMGWWIIRGIKGEIYACEPRTFEMTYDELAETPITEYDLNDFQEDALRTAVYPGSGTNEGLTYTILGLCGEAGELANKLKKHLRNGTPVNQEVLRDELSDVLWYCAACAKELGTDLNALADFNIKKLTERHKAGTIKDR